MESDPFDTAHGFHSQWIIFTGSPIIAYCFGNGGGV